MYLLYIYIYTHTRKTLISGGHDLPIICGRFAMKDGCYVTKKKGRKKKYAAAKPEKQ